MFEMTTLAERIGIPSLSIGSLGAWGIGAVIESPAWQFAIGLIGMLAGITAFVWGVIKIYDWICNKRQERRNKKLK